MYLKASAEIHITTDFTQLPANNKLYIYHIELRNMNH